MAEPNLKFFAARAVAAMAIVAKACGGTAFNLRTNSHGASGDIELADSAAISLSTDSARRLAQLAVKAAPIALRQILPVDESASVARCLDADADAVRRLDPALFESALALATATLSAQLQTVARVTLKMLGGEIVNLTKGANPPATDAATLGTYDGEAGDPGDWTVDTDDDDLDLAALLAQDDGSGLQPDEVIGTCPQCGFHGVVRVDGLDDDDDLLADPDDAMSLDGDDDSSLDDDADGMLAMPTVFQSDGKVHLAARSIGSNLIIDRKAGVIRNASIMQAGPAKGHGFMIDGTMLKQVTSQMANGVPMRFTHPSATGDSLGTHVGKVINAKLDPSGKITGDIQFGKHASNVPGLGDVAGYLLDLAESDPQAFGLSVVFDAADFEQSPTGLVGRSAGVDACDLTGSPAANPAGLLSTRKPPPN